MKKKVNRIAKNNVPDLKESIKSTPEYQTFMQASQQRSRFTLPFKKLSYGLSAVVLIIALFMVLPLQETSSSSEIYFEVNPSFHLVMDDEDIITEFTPLNEDGETLKEQTGSLEGLPFETAIDHIIDEAIALDMIIADESIVMYDVINENADLEQRHLDLIEDKLNRVKEDKMINFDMARGIGGLPTENERNLANDYDIGIMQARLIGNILSETDEYTFEELVEYSMRDLMQLSEVFPPREDHGPRRHPFDDNGTPPIEPPRGRQ